MKNSNSKGIWGEEIAASFLIKKDYKIIQKNYNTKYGEIDIICRRHDGILVFVEVKTRSDFDKQKLYSSINFLKIEKIKKTASLYLQQNNDSESTCRFDVIFIVGDDKKHDITHIENAF